MFDINKLDLTLAQCKKYFYLFKSVLINIYVMNSCAFITTNKKS